MSKPISMNDLPWLAEAAKYIGEKEVPGKKNNHNVVRWWKSIKAPFRDDETPWCAAFVGGVLDSVDIKSTYSAAARSYTRWGVRLDGPAVGAIVVFWRGKRDGWSGHVGFVVGKDDRGNIMVLGGNQGNSVSIKPFAKDRVLSYHWPKACPLPANQGGAGLTLLASDGKLSTNEA